jgi:MFS family permease
MSPDANFTSSQQGILLAGTAIGGIAAIGPVPLLISALGLRIVFSAFGLFSGLVTFLLPFLFSIGGFWALLAIRIIQGLCLMPAMVKIRFLVQDIFNWPYIFPARHESNHPSLGQFGSSGAWIIFDFAFSLYAGKK